MMLRGIAVAAVVSAASTLGAATAHADTPARTMTLVPPPCTSPVDLAALAAAARVELGEMGVDRVEVSTSVGDGASVSLGPDCDPAAFALRLRLGPGDVVPNRERVMDLVPVPDEARPRAAAIALAELLAAAREDPRGEGRLLEPPPPISDAPLGPAPANVSAPPPRERPFRFVGGIMARVWVEAPDLHLGPRIEARLPIADAFDATIGGAVLFASSTDPLGDVSTRTLLGRAGVSFVRGGTPLLLDVGPSLEVAAFTGSANAARRDVAERDASAAVLAAALDGAVEVTPVEPFRLRLDLEVGAAVVGHETLVGPRQTSSYSGLEGAASLSTGLAL